MLIGADYPVAEPEQPMPPEPQEIDFESLGQQRILTEDEQEIDLSEFCMPPPPGLSPEELKAFLEEQDAEIARLLQHQELKRNKNDDKEKKAIIEAQDRAIARLLQRQEKEKAKRMKEKLRQKQLQQQLQQETDNDNFQLELTETHDVNYQRTSTPISPQNSFEESNANNTANRVHENDYDIPENHLVDGEQTDLNESQTYEEPYQILSQQRKEQVVSPVVSGNFYNIAMDLDPTYQRRRLSPQTLQQSQPCLQQASVIETCVDDDYEASVATEDIVPNERVASTSRDDGGHIKNSLRALAKSHDSLHKMAAGKNRHSPTGLVNRLVQSSTTSSRSSCTSHSSGSHLSSSRSHRSLPQPTTDDDYPPPLPPREGSLMSRQSDFGNSGSNSILPPHHPQHPNRRNNSPFSFHSSGSNSPNRNSIYFGNNLPIQGQRRVASMEKQKTKAKSKSKDEGCRTQ